MGLSDGDEPLGERDQDVQVLVTAANVHAVCMSCRSGPLPNVLGRNILLVCNQILILDLDVCRFARAYPKAQELSLLVGVGSASLQVLNPRVGGSSVLLFGKGCF